ncbi:hypothetical protein OG21DRAFT_813398 [Imleria badia]|nr:hypothetical protein OG21DRAFT_813398 [Imleria badia]
MMPPPVAIWKVLPFIRHIFFAVPPDFFLPPPTCSHSLPCGDRTRHQTSTLAFHLPSALLSSPFQCAPFPPVQLTGPSPECSRSINCNTIADCARTRISLLEFQQPYLIEHGYICMLVLLVSEQNLATCRWSASQVSLAEI